MSCQHSVRESRRLLQTRSALCVLLRECDVGKCVRRCEAGMPCCRRVADVVLLKETAGEERKGGMGRREADLPMIEAPTSFPSFCASIVRVVVMSAPRAPLSALSRAESTDTLLWRSASCKLSPCIISSSFLAGGGIMQYLFLSAIPNPDVSVNHL